MIATTNAYLQSLDSNLTTRDYLSTIWAMGYGGAGLLNSSFYQRYLGRRDTLRLALVQQILDLPKQYRETLPDSFPQSLSDTLAS